MNIFCAESFCEKWARVFIPALQFCFWLSPRSGGAFSFASPLLRGAPCFKKSPAAGARRW
ncbi:hypothetical protein B0D78_07940 [Pyramidobacter sp. C12-8]|nr:hypothetical protein B0D78_07940 [Pyramidobacter sp. C12-8]RKJ78696.1 hypothetical protein D7D26_06190 [Pyramidobacter sp. CG50-2]